MLTLDTTLSAFEGNYPSACVSPAAAAEIRRISAHFPAALASIYVLENRLQADAEQVDFSLCVNHGTDGAKIMGSGIPSHYLDQPAWAGVSAFCQRWITSGSTLDEQVGHIWLEFDAAGEGIPPPAIYLGPKFDGDKLRVWRGDLAWLLDEALTLLNGAPVNPTILDQVRRCLVVLGEYPEAQIFEVGLMLSRPPVDFVRLCLRGIPKMRILEYLGRIGWKGEQAAVQEAINLLDSAEGIELYVDVGMEILPRVGLECRLDPPHNSDQSYLRWEGLLNTLVEKSLCTAPKRDGLLAWSGMNRGRLPGEEQVRMLWRLLSHIKLVCAPGRPIEAKGYMTLLHQPPPPTKPKALRIGADHPLIKRLQDGVRGEVLPPGEKYARDFSRMFKKPLFVTVMAQDEGDISHTLKVNQSANLPLMIRGAGYSSGAHLLPDHAVAVIMSRPREPQITFNQDHSVVVGAGTRWFDLEQTLHIQGRTIGPLMASLASSVGGTLAAGSGFGFRSIRYGGVLDQVRRLRLIRLTGEAVWCGPEDQPDLFRESLGGFGKTGVISAAELNTIPYQPFTAMHFYEHPSPEALAKSLAELASDLDRTPDLLRGWIRPDGVFGSAFGLEQSDPEQPVDPALRLGQVPAGGRAEVFPDYHTFVHQAVHDHLREGVDQVRLWADHMVEYEGLRRLCLQIESLRSRIAPFLYMARMLAIRRPAGGLNLPYAPHHWGTEPIKYLVGVYCDVPSVDTAAINLVRECLAELQTITLQSGGRVCPWGWREG